jgi:hypothetical protein
MNARLSQIKWLRTLGNLSYLLGAALLIASLAVNALPAGLAFAKGDPGAIWTTTGSCGSPQDANLYQVGDKIYINGSGFSAGDHDWHIKGQSGGASGDPGDVVASGTVTVDAGGAFCFAAYTVNSDDWGEYSAKVGNKGDNYHVDAEPTVAPTDPPTEEPTVAPTDPPTEEPTVSPTDPPTEAPTVAPIDPPTEEPTVAPTDPPTEAPTVAPTDPPTDAPTNTPTQQPGDPTATPTPESTQNPGLSLNVSSFCGPDSSQLNWWKIANKDSSDAAITWVVMPLGAPSEDYLLPGHSTYKFSTPKSSENDQLDVYDAQQNFIASVSAAGDCQPHKATPTDVPSNPNPASPDTQAQVLIPVTGAALDAGSGLRVVFFNLGIGFLGLGLVLNGVARQRKSRDL